MLKKDNIQLNTIKVNIPKRKGIVVRLNPEGEFGYLQEEHSDRQFIFKFNKILGLKKIIFKKKSILSWDKGFGLKVGAKVHFDADKLDRIEKISIAKNDSIV